MHWTPLQLATGLTIPQLMAMWAGASYSELGLQAAYDRIDAKRQAKGLPPIDRGGSFERLGTDGKLATEWVKARKVQRESGTSAIPH